MPLQELIAIQANGPKDIGFFGTRNMGFSHQNLVEILSYAMVLTVRLPDEGQAAFEPCPPSDAFAMEAVLRSWVTGLKPCQLGALAQLPAWIPCKGHSTQLHWVGMHPRISHTLQSQCEAWIPGLGRPRPSEALTV